MSPPSGEAAHPEHAPQRVAASKGHKRGGNRGRNSPARRTVQAINVNADVRQKARDGHDVAGWRARCSCGWNTLVKVGVEDAHGPAVTKAWTEHSKRFDNDRHLMVRALPELGSRDLLPHANAVQRLTGDLESLFGERRVETAGQLRERFYGSTAHYREDR